MGDWTFKKVIPCRLIFKDGAVTCSTCGYEISSKDDAWWISKVQELMYMNCKQKEPQK